MLAKEEIQTEKSKALILRNLETSADFEEKLLNSLVTDIKKSMTREDFIDYSSLLRNEGLTTAEIAAKIKYSDSWVKKYVPPKAALVTEEKNVLLPDQKNTTLGPGNLPITKVIIMSFEVAELKKEQREFKGWGSAEVKDAQGDKIPIDSLEQIMPTYMKRGGVIMYGHSNRHVGNLNKYAIRNKEVNGKETPGLWLEGNIYSDYKIDDLAWEALQIAKETGQPVLSLGATPLGSAKYECNEKECYSIHSDLQLYEFSVTEIQRGSIGANPEATIDKISVSKAELEKSQNMQKIPEQVAGKYYSMQKAGSLPEDEDSLVNLMLGTCTFCQDEYKSLIKSGKSEIEAKKELYNGLLKTMNDLSKEDAQTQTEKQDPPVEPGAAPEADLGAVLQEILAGLNRLEAAISAEKQGPPEEEEEKADEEADEEKADPPVEEPPKAEALTLSKDFQTQFETLAKQLGYKKVPGITTPKSPQRDLIKTAKDQKGAGKKVPSMDERLEMFKDGSLFEEF